MHKAAENRGGGCCGVVEAHPRQAPGGFRVGVDGVPPMANQGCGGLDGVPSSEARLRFLWAGCRSTSGLPLSDAGLVYGSIVRELLNTASGE